MADLRFTPHSNHVHLLRSPAVRGKLMQSWNPKGNQCGCRRALVQGCPNRNPGRFQCLPRCIPETGAATRRNAARKALEATWVSCWYIHFCSARGPACSRTGTPWGSSFASVSPGQQATSASGHGYYGGEPKICHAVYSYVLRYGLPVPTKKKNRKEISLLRRGPGKADAPPEGCFAHLGGQSCQSTLARSI